MQELELIRFGQIDGISIFFDTADWKRDDAREIRPTGNEAGKQEHASYPNNSKEPADHTILQALIVCQISRICPFVSTSIIIFVAKRKE